jgi:death-on-curing protein
VKQPRWVPRLVVEAIHFDQLREHGGLAGLGDEHLLESALARPQQKWAYKRKPDLAMLAASYAFGIVRNHPFRDGNKRVAFLTAVTFLGVNGYELEAEESEIVAMFRAAAAGESSEGSLARWFRGRIERR